MKGKKIGKALTRLPRLFFPKYLGCGRNFIQHRVVTREEDRYDNPKQGVFLL